MKLRRTPHPLRSGFTLMEVLVALLITGLLMVAVTQILTATRYTRDSIHNVQEMQLAGPAILDLLESDLRGLNLYNRESHLTLRVKNRVMSGLDGDSLDFVTSNNALIPVEDGDRWLYADLVEVGYRMRTNPEDNDFLELYRREDFGVDDEPFEGGSFGFLHDRVVAFDIQVFEEDGPDAEPLEDWNADDRDPQPLPRWIEIELTLELSPRLTREQIRFLPVDKRRVTYRRILHLPESLFLVQELQPVPVIPDIDPPNPDDPALGGDPGAGGLDDGSGGAGGLDILSGAGGGGGGDNSGGLGLGTGGR